MILIVTDSENLHNSTCAVIKWDMNYTLYDNFFNFMYYVYRRLEMLILKIIRKPRNESRIYAPLILEYGHKMGVEKSLCTST